MNTRQIQYVMMVAEERSFSEAARKLYIAQPSLSKYIKKTEEELGYPLFDRETSPLRLTPAGEIYLRTAHEMLNLEREMGRQMQDIYENQSGKIRIGISPYSTFLPYALQKFLTEYPNYEIDIEDSVNSSERLRLLENGDLDLCIQPILSPLNAKFSVEEIMQDTLLLVIPADYAVNTALRERALETQDYPEIAVSDLKMLSEAPFVMVDDKKKLNNDAVTLLSQAGVQPHIKVICHQSERCVELASFGIGATMVQLSYAKNKLFPHDVCCYRIRQTSFSNCFAAIYVKNRYLSRAAKAFIGCVAELYR